MADVNQKVRLVFSGAGGQGVITAAIILAEAAALHEGLTAVQSQSYGPEARGGATRSDVIISSSEIMFPKVNQPNILICLTQEAYNKFASIVRPGGLLITDSRNVKTERKVDARQKELPLYEQVMEKIEKPIVLNICMLGAVNRLAELLKPESIIRVLEDRFSGETLEINKTALRLGAELAENYI